MGGLRGRLSLPAYGIAFSMASRALPVTSHQSRQKNTPGGAEWSFQYVLGSRPWYDSTSITRSSLVLCMSLGYQYLASAWLGYNIVQGCSMQKAV